MVTGLFGKLDHFARGTIPVITAFMVVLLAVVPLKIPEFGYLKPAFVLMAVYYWAIYRPDLLPMVAVFLLGLLYDLLTGGMIGANALVLLIAYAVVVSQRRFFQNKSFGVIWWGFMLVASGAAFLAWVIACIHATAILDPLASVFGLALTVLMYPLAAALLSQAHKAVPSRDEKA